MSQLGTCDKKQYEHCGPHEQIHEHGQSMPPFPCVNWKAAQPEPPSPEEKKTRVALLYAKTAAPSPVTAEATLKELVEMPDEQIDTSDIPEVTDWSKAERGKFYRGTAEAAPSGPTAEKFCRDELGISLKNMHTVWVVPRGKAHGDGDYWSVAQIAEAYAAAVSAPLRRELRAKENDLLNIEKELGLRGISFCVELAEEGTPWECAAEPEPAYFATLSEAIDFRDWLIKADAHGGQGPVNSPSGTNQPSQEGKDAP